MITDMQHSLHLHHCLQVKHQEILSTRYTYHAVYEPFIYCRPYAEKYAESQEAFFDDYIKAHLKLSELGVKWDPEPIQFDE